MKKVICAVAAFAMVAGIATVASAEVSLSGDARARLVYTDDGDDSYSSWNSRVRLRIIGTTESGAYMKARVLLFSEGWGANMGDGPFDVNDSLVETDYAFLGFKTNGFDLSAGRQRATTTLWFLNDKRSDRLKIAYGTGGMTFAYTYDQFIETKEVEDDLSMHGLFYNQKINDSFTVTAQAFYQEDSAATDMDGLLGTVNLEMNFGANTIVVEQSWKDGDAMGTVDDQLGGYVSWSAALGSITPTVTLGYTQDGFLVDGDFSYIMIGDGWATSAVTNIGEGGDTIFIGTTADMALSEKLNLQGNIVYMDVDTLSGLDDKLLELSGMVSYEIIKGAKLSFKAGALDYADSDTEIAAVTRVDVKF
ncbi:hypothetical protein JYT85_01245 [Desulfocapsa sp. AH-315-G09]|nr:hypothetical protein [Desulfocapsa sp.]MBN4059945.1 hypothetical protein [Desulfotalea psychrophila]MBN4065258.1 hypothetical protein [Desulfocapsa sp. AH-315-G09]